jgi:hypothetical protein
VLHKPNPLHKQTAVALHYGSAQSPLVVIVPDGRWPGIATAASFALVKFTMSDSRPSGQSNRYSKQFEIGLSDTPSRSTRLYQDGKTNEGK